MKLTAPAMLAAMFCVSFGLLVLNPAVHGQSRPLVDPSAGGVYQRLLPQIERIKIFDHHAHPAFADDADVDAAPVPPSSLPLRMRDDNPELIAAAKALFGFPYADLGGTHAKWLTDKKAALKAQNRGARYFNTILDRLGIETSIANRVAMASYLDPARFKWVCFVDSFMFPFDNSALAARNPDEAVFMPMQTKMLQRYEKQASVGALPPTLNDYLSFITRTLDENRKRGAIAVKFEAAYFRSLSFDDPPRETASAIYEKYHGGGLPGFGEYKTFQDFIFRHIVTEAGRLRLPVHIHSSVGAGDYFSLRGVNVLQLESILHDPRYLRTTFVLIHGGFPFEREAIYLAAMKNVYFDSSAVEFLLYPTDFKGVLRRWLETYPEKVTFGSDAFPYGETLGVEESYWLGVQTARMSLAAALAEMVATREISEPRAIELAHAYLHDTAARLYSGSPTRSHH